MRPTSLRLMLGFSLSWLLLGIGAGCTVGWTIDRLAHRLVDDYCALGELERSLFRARFNETSANKVMVQCAGNVLP